MELGSISRRDDFITCLALTAQGADAYDDTGKEITTGETTTVSFWGDIKDGSSGLDFDTGKRRDLREITITADSRDVKGLTIEFTLTYGGSTDVFQVVDIVNSTFRYTSTITAQYMNI